MYRLKDQHLPEYCNQLFKLHTVATKSTLQASHSTTYFVDGTDKMTYEVEYTDEFEQWYLTLDEETQDSIDVAVELLEERGPNLRFPHSSGIKGSRQQHMRELRIQHQGKPYRILYAFDPRRVAVLLLGGNKAGSNRWYEENVPKADKLYDELLKELDDEEIT